jgi:hypothetical protein
MTTHHASRPRNGRICAYCGEPRLDGYQRAEHPIPAALGSSLKVYTVCNGCNGRANVEIDKPFLSDPLLLSAWSLAGVRDPRRGQRSRVPRSPLVYLDEQGVPRQTPRVVDLGEGRYQVRASTEEEAQELLEEFTRRRLRDGFKVNFESREHRSGRPEIRSTVSTHVHTWTKAASKAALAIGSYVDPEEWRTGSDASRLREWMRAEDQSRADNVAPGMLPRHAPDRLKGLLSSTAEHLVFFHRRDDQVLLNVALFGGQCCYSIPVGSAEDSVPEHAWLLDSRRPRTSGETTWSQLLNETVRRVVDQTAA